MQKIFFTFLFSISTLCSSFVHIAHSSSQPADFSLIADDTDAGRKISKKKAISVPSTTSQKKAKSSSSKKLDSAPLPRKQAGKSSSRIDRDNAQNNFRTSDPSVGMTATSKKKQKKRREKIKSSPQSGPTAKTNKHNQREMKGIPQDENSKESAQGSHMTEKFTVPTPNITKDPNSKEGKILSTKKKNEKTSQVNDVTQRENSSFQKRGEPESSTDKSTSDSRTDKSPMSTKLLRDENQDYYFVSPLHDEVEQNKAMPIHMKESTLVQLDTSLEVPPYVEPNMFTWLSDVLKKEERKRLVSKKLLKERNNPSSPWLSHGCLMARYKASIYLGSGIIISIPEPTDSEKQNLYIATAAHNIVKTIDRNKTIADAVSFYPAMISYDPETQREEDNPICLKGRAAIMPQDFYNKAERNKDLALITFQQSSPPFNCKTYDIFSHTEETITEIFRNDFPLYKGVNVTGYPAISPYKGRHMISTNHPIKRAKDGRVYYAPPTWEGQSGGGVWIEHKTQGDSSYTLIAIHTYGSVDNKRVCSATLLTQDNIDRIKAWKPLLEAFCSKGRSTTDE